MCVLHKEASKNIVCLLQKLPCLSLEKTVVIDQLKLQQHKTQDSKNGITGEERDLRYFEQNTRKIPAPPVACKNKEVLTEKSLLGKRKKKKDLVHLVLADKTSQN